MVDQTVNWGELRAHLKQRAHWLGWEPQVVDDLVQEALYEAWRARDRIYDSEGVSRWADAILRHVRLRFLRRLAAERRCQPAPDLDGVAVAPVAMGGTPDEVADLEIELDRDQLVDLLDRSLGLLPAATRDLLVRRFVEELPIDELAASLGINEAAVKMRLQRGKATLQRILTTRYPEEASSFGLLDGAGRGWTETRLWCPLCGSARLRTRVSGARRAVEFRCFACTPQSRPSSMPARLCAVADTKSTGLRTFGSIWNRLMAKEWENWLSPRPDRDGSVVTRRVLEAMTVRHDGGPSVFHGEESVDYRRKLTHNVAAPMVALASPAGQLFQRRHRRIRLCRYDEIDAGGVLAIRSRFESVPGGAGLEVVVTRDDFQLITVAS